MFTIMWIPQRFPVLNSVPDCTTMSSTLFIDNILTKTAVPFFPDGRREQSPTVTLHLDICSVHRSRKAENLMEQNGVESMPRPPYSPDSAPSDFFLFPLVKKRPDRLECEDSDNLLEGITEIFRTLQTDRLQCVFQEADRGSIFH
jgi:transposase